MSNTVEIKSNYTQPVNHFWNKTHQTNVSFIFSLLLYLAYATVFLVGLLANIFVIVMIIKRRRMRTSTNRFLLNLAISDLIATLICLPPTAYHYYDKRWMFGEFLCRLIPFVQGTSVAVSIFTLMAVSIDRFIAIQKPIHSKLLCTPTRITMAIVFTWIFSFILMTPLILHHRIVDPYDITLSTCAEEWRHYTNGRLVYDFLLLILLFILPMSLMTYCYVRISFSLWFIDSNIQTPGSSSVTNVTRTSRMSEDFPHQIRRYLSQSPRLSQVFYPKIIESNLNETSDEPKQLIKSNSDRQSIPLNNTRDRARRYSEADFHHRKHQIQINGQTERPTVHRQRHSISQYNSALAPSSISSLVTHHRLIVDHSYRSTIDLNHTSRFLRSRRRVVKLLITLILVFFITRIPLHILSIYIDFTSHTEITNDVHRNFSVTNDQRIQDVLAMYHAYVDKTSEDMFFVLYVNPIFQLLSLSNSAINPLCYCFMSHAVKQIMVFFQQKIQRGHKKCSSLTLVR